MKQQILAERDIDTINTLLYELTCLRRWSQVTVEGGKYTELSKQALNCAITYFWAIGIQHYGIEIDFNVFPKIAIVRSIVKSFQCDIPESNLESIFKLGNISKKSFYEMIQSEMENILGKSFQEFLKYDSNCIEAKIYRASTKLATWLELQEIKHGISAKDFKEKNSQINKELNNFSNLPGFKSIVSQDYMSIFESFSKLRNRIRWAKHPNIIKNSVLAHSFDVAIFSYIMSLENIKHSEALATRFFFFGIFHDFPESWTGDMPSPIKDNLEGLRKATEIFENIVMRNYVYSQLPEYQVKALKRVMLEEDENSNLKKFLKKSDNFAAVVECWREIDAGSKHPYYFNVIKNDYKKKEDLPPLFRLLIEHLYSEAFGIY